MSRFGDQLRRLTENLGSLNDLRRGFDKGFAPASEDARSVLYKYRESIGLDEPPQAAEVASRSGLLQALRDGLSAHGAPEPIGFNDGMLKERLEVGQSILDDPKIFQEALDERLELEKEKALQKLKEDRPEGTLAAVRTSDDFGFLEDEIKNLTLDKNTEREVIAETAKKVKRMMREQSILKKLGYNAGAIAGDINEDRSRSLYWLLNAPQAVTATSADLLMSGTSPNLRSMRSITRLDLRKAEEQGLLRRTGNKPLTFNQRQKLEADGVIHPGERGIEESIYLNLDNFEPAQPGIRRKYDPNIENILKKKELQPGVPEGEDKTANKGDSVFGQRRISPSTLAFAGLGGTALATNAGLGLTGTEDTGIPFVGRREGYAAASPDELDPRKSNNAFFEAGTRYLLSRDGRMLPKADFMLERPDVSAQEYADYNAYSFGKDLDFNPFDDGKANLGIIKFNNDGIHGREVQILGQTLSENEAGIPLAGAMLGMGAGAVLPNLRQIRLAKQRSSWTPGKGKRGVLKNIMGYIPEVRAKRYDRKEDTNPNNPLLKNKFIDNATQKIEDYFLETNPVTGKLDMNSGRVIGALGVGTFGGVGLGTLIGLEREDRRRRENFEENRPGIDFDTYKQNARELLDQKYRIMASDPDRTEKLEKSKSGFNRVSQQEGLMNYMQEQQSVIDQIGDAYLRGKAKEAMEKQEWAKNKLDSIEQERNRRKEKQAEGKDMYPLTSLEDESVVINPYTY